MATQSRGHGTRARRNRSPADPNYCVVVAISHVCNSCGLDLVRTLPRRDPSLNLPIVVCPGCAHAVVRRRHPIHGFWRAARRMDTALSILLVQGLIALGLLSFIGAMTARLAEAAAERQESAPGFVIGAFGDRDAETRLGNHVIRHDDGWDVAILMTALVSAIAGLWLTATLAHLPLWKRWLGWGALLVGCVSLGWVGWAYDTAVALLIGEPGLAGGVDARLWLLRVQLLLGAVGVMLAASPLGLPIRWVLSRARGSMWRRQLRRARYSRGRDA
jgi:hypothetical protein